MAVGAGGALRSLRPAARDRECRASTASDRSGGSIERLVVVLYTGQLTSPRKSFIQPPAGAGTVPAAHTLVTPLSSWTRLTWSRALGLTPETETESHGLTGSSRRQRGGPDSNHAAACHSARRLGARSGGTAGETRSERTCLRDGRYDSVRGAGTITGPYAGQEQRE